MFKEKILLFFDALLDLFEGNNKIIYYKVVLYRHQIQNIMTTSELLKNCTDFIVIPTNYEMLKRQNIQSINNYTPETLSAKIFDQLMILLNSCSIENQKIIWKWIDNIIYTIIIEANIDISNIYDMYSLNER